MKTKNTLLIIVILAIVGAIFYLQSISTHPQQVQRTELTVTNTSTQDAATTQRLQAKDKLYPKAIELVHPDAYINTAPFNLSDYIGKKVIMIDFWTYSCINCQRTLPYLTAWDAKYRDQGLLIVGVHTPEFAFEKELANVQRAVEKYGVKYPVVLDNERQTWTAYQNHYWPRHYLIDIDGYIVEDHIGEGGYVETEQKIQELLKERRQVLGLNMSIDTSVADVQNVDVKAATAEIYFGYATARGQLGNAEGWQPEQIVNYVLPDTRKDNLFYLNGSWMNNPDNMESQGGNVFLTYAAQSVNIVASSAEPASVQVIVDGKTTQNITVQAADLYKLASGEYGKHNLELKVPEGVKLYTFTFG